MRTYNRLLILATLLAMTLLTALPQNAEAQNRRRHSDRGFFRPPGTSIRIFPAPQRVIRLPGGITVYETDTFWHYGRPRGYVWPYGRPRGYVWPYRLR